MIGSAVGGYVDPDVIEGPRLNDAQMQTSTEGVPRPIIYGTYVVAGNIIQRGPLVHTTTSERQGKGGPVVKEHHYSMSYAIRVCEGPIAGIRRIWRDDKIVYDARTDADISAHYSGSSSSDLATYLAERVGWSAGFANRCTFYLGDETQLPDATLEGLPAIYGGGVGNVPAYRGTCYVVVANDDLTERRGTIPQYRFEVVSVGTEGIAEGAIQPLLFAGSSYPWADNADTLKDPRRSGATYRYRYSGSGTWRDTVEEAWTDADVTLHITGTPVLRGWAATGISDSGGVGIGDAFAPWDVSGLPSDAFSQVKLVYSRYPAGLEEYSVVIASSPNSACATFAAATWARRVYDGGGGNRFGSGVYVSSGAILAGADTSVTCDGGGGGEISRFSDFAITCEAVLDCGGVSDDWLAVPDADGYYYDLIGREIVSAADCDAGAGSFKQLGAYDVAVLDNSIQTYPLGPILESTDANYSNEAWWTARYNEAVARGDMPAGMTYSSTGLHAASSHYPVFSATACACSDLTTISPDSLQLWELVTDVCGRVGVDETYLEVSDLTQEVRGTAISRQMEAAAAIRAWQPCYHFDFPEWGDYTDDHVLLRGVNRGSASLFTITDDDLIESDDDEEARAQALEFPRKVNVISADVQADYNPTKQTAERRTTSVRAVGELTMEIPIATTRDEAAQIADKTIKIAWAEAEGRMERQLPEEFYKITPSDVFTYDSKRWRVQRAEYLDGIVKVEAARDRASAYTSNATAGDSQGPAFHGAGLRGPTLTEIINSSLLDESTDQLGLYVAVCGVLDGWLGAEVRFEDAAGVQFASKTITTPCGIGTTTTALSAGSRYVYGDTATVTVNLWGTEPEDATWAQLIAEHNACVIGDEVLQFADALDNGDGTWTLTGLLRGRLNSTAASHAIGSRFVLLNAPVFVACPAAVLGATITVHPISLGTAAEDNDTETFAFTTAASQTEWAPYYFQGTRDGSDNVTVSFIGRGRLGTSKVPYHSSYFDGYRITYTSGATSVSYVTTSQSHTYTEAMQVLDFGSAPVSLDVSIVALNRITGASSALTGTV